MLNKLRLKFYVLFWIHTLLDKSLRVLELPTHFVTLPKQNEIKISFPLKSASTDELISAPKIMTFFPMLHSLNESCERE